MSTSPKNTAVRAGALAGFLAMAVAGWQLAGESAAASIGASAPGAIDGKASQRRARPASRYGTPAHVREAMKTIRNAGSTEARMRATIELANTLPISELAAWLDGRWFDTGEGFDLTLFNKIAKHRWEKEDPEGLLVWSFKNGPETAQSILTGWAGSDPQRMIAFFKEHPDDAREINALAKVAQSDPALALGRLQEMIARGISPDAAGYYDQQLLNQLATKSPAVLEAALDSLPGPWQDKIEAALVGQRLQTSFSEEIRKLWERPDGWKLLSNQCR